MISTLKNTCVLVANSSKARFFFSGKDDKGLTEQDTLINPYARSHEQELISDRPGRTFDSYGGARHAKEKSVDKKHYYRLNFAKDVAEQLDNFDSTRHFSNIVLAASPGFLGDLNKKLSSQIKTHIALVIDKDLTMKTAQEIDESINTVKK